MEITFESLTTQDFFFECLLFHGCFQIFVRLSLLNNRFRNAISRYQKNKNVWRKLCERDFKMWMPGNDVEWNLHFSKLKPENYFGIYSYFWGVLNQQHIIMNQKFIIPIPLYFAAKVYKIKIENAMDLLERSTRKIAFITKNFEKENISNSISVKDCLPNSIVPPLPLNWIYSNTKKPSSSLFSYVICSNSDCQSTEFTKTHVHSGFVETAELDHFRDEEKCLTSGACISSNNQEYAKLHHLHIDGPTPDFIRKEEYEAFSLSFLKNKIFSMA